MRIEQIAELCHETNRVYCRLIGDNSQPAWPDAPDWQKDSAISGVKFHLDNRNSPPSRSHEEWLKTKEADGWKYGPVKDPEKKEHPCCVPYDSLPENQKVKDTLFVSIVNAFPDVIQREPVDSIKPSDRPREHGMSKIATVIVLVLVSIGCVAFAVAQPLARPQVQQPKRDWQDVVLQPDQAWKGNVKSNNADSTAVILAMDRFFVSLADNDLRRAYNDWQQNIAIQNANRKILALEKLIVAVTKRVDALEKPVNDANDLRPDSSNVNAEDPNEVE